MLVAQLFGWTGTKSSTTSWEYWVESPKDELLHERFVALGREGWELVFARRATDSGTTALYEMIFKRPRR